MINKFRTSLLPLLFLYLSILCVYVGYLYIIRDYNITKSIYQPYKTFLQISSFSFHNIVIAPLKGVVGVIGFFIFLFKKKQINTFSTLFLVISTVEVLMLILFEFFLFSRFSDYIDKTAVVITALLFSFLTIFYFKNAKIKEQAVTIVCGIFLTVISYYLH